MPIMQVTYPEAALSRSQKEDLAQRLTEVLIAMEGGADTESGRGFAWVIFTPVEAGDYWVGGRSDARFTHPPGAFLVHVSIPEGYMNAAHKAEVHRLVNDAVLAATGHPAAAGAGGSVLTVIDEVTEGNWGCAGHPIGLAAIAEAVGTPPQGERFAWVRAYFAAKARLHAAAAIRPTWAGCLRTPAPARRLIAPLPRISTLGRSPAPHDRRPMTGARHIHDHRNPNRRHGENNMPCNTSTWMTDNYAAIQNKPFSQITLFGSHDSGMSSLISIAGSIAGRSISQAQGLSVHDQVVSAGVRYLDIRSVYYSAYSGGVPASGYYTAHYTTAGTGYVGWLGQSLAEVISDLGAAVQAIGGNDILLVELSHGVQLIDNYSPESGPWTEFQPMTQAQLDEVAGLFAQDPTLGSYLYQVTPAPSSPVDFWSLTPGDFAAAGKKVFLFAGANTATGTIGGPVFQKPACANYYSPGTGCSTDDPGSLISQLAADMRTNLKPSPSLPYLLAYHCTGQVNGPSLQQLASDLDPVFQDSLASWCGQGIIDQAAGRLPVIVTTDWVSSDTSSLLAPCIGMTSGQYQGIVSWFAATGQTCQKGPAVAWQNGVLYLAWAGTGHGSLNFLWTVDGRATYETKGVTSAQTEQSPALCTSGATLNLAWAGTDDSHKPNLAQVVLNGTSVEALSNQRSFGQTSVHGPAIAGLNGTLYLAWTDAHANALSIMNLSDGSVYLSAETSTDSPALCCFGGNLWIAWKAADGYVSVGQLALTGTTVSNIVNVVDLQQATEHGPAIASFEGAMYVAWIDTRSRVNLICSPDGKTFGSPYISIQASGGSPALCASDQGLCLAWGGVNTGTVYFGNYRTAG